MGWGGVGGMGFWNIIFARIQRIAFELGKFPNSKALILVVSMDICQLVVIKT